MTQPLPVAGPDKKQSNRSIRRGTRRDFIRQTTVGAAAVAAGVGFARPAPAAQDNMPEVCIVPDASDPLLRQSPVVWAVEQLQEALQARGSAARVCATMEEVPRRSECVLVARSGSPLGRDMLQSAQTTVPENPEALGLLRAKLGKRPVLLACGSDERGLVYGLLELADQVRLGDEPLALFKNLEPTVEKPANVVRSVARCFVSDVEDKPWFNDRSFWQRYLTMLATQRFNRFSLTLGIGYDFTTDIRDCYFHFAYPFLVPVPGYNVRAEPLPDAEREKNLKMLRFISDETARRGLHFQLGLWTHAYKWSNSPKANYIIEGLTPENHAPYCRDALRLLLQDCPAINGITFRIHGESGVPEGSYQLWKTIFDGIVQCGRRVEIDMHAKGMDQAMIDVALGTGMPVNISPKYWAEHMGLPYMQGAIRPLEMPPRESTDAGFFSRSSGSRRFLRYGYGDLLPENRRHGVLHRVWPGTQRLLLWGDPEMAAEYGRASSFCGSVGVELCEPLSFKGRKGSGLPGGREAYADASLRPKAGDFEKYLYTYRVWGRNLYNPDGKAEGWQRPLRRQFGAGAPRVELALKYASRILPMVTTAHCPSAANNNYWPELYTNMPVVDASRPHPYGDTLNPKRFGAVSSLDPEFFSRIDDFADELLKRESSARYSPLWVSAWLGQAASRANALLAEARPKVRDSMSAEFRRLSTDVAIQAGLGHFFAWKFRAGILYALYERSNHRLALDEALKAYRQARAAWAELAQQAKGVYAEDITFGYDRHLRGHWLDRLPAIDQDIADLEKLLAQANAGGTVTLKTEPQAVEQAIRVVSSAARPAALPVLTRFHTPPRRFERGKPLILQVTLAGPNAVPKLSSIRLRYRHVNQAETWQVQGMEAQVTGYRAAVLGIYTESPFPLQYHFELRTVSGAAWFYPGLRPDSLGQPYFVVRSG